MTEWKARRFWTASAIEEAGQGFQVLLDARPLRTPGRLPLILPTADLALAVAGEWDAQGDVIDPNAMPLTRAANSAIEKVAPQFADVADMLAGYGGTDLLSYRADRPAELVRRQAEAWDPLVDWAATDLRGPLRITHGVIPVDQDSRSLSQFHRHLTELDAFGLTALHDLVTLPGSLVLGLAVIRGRIDADTAFRLSRIDEDFQIERWGADDEAEAAAESRKQAMRVAERVWHLSRAG